MNRSRSHAYSISLRLHASATPHKKGIGHIICLLDTRAIALIFADYVATPIRTKGIMIYTNRFANL